MAERTPRISTGIPGLDEILRGGFLANRTYLITGSPGTGKTVLGLQVLGASPQPAKTLFISFNQREEHVRQDAASVAVDAGAISFLDLTAEAEIFTQVQTYDIFSPVEVEREPIAHAICSRIEELEPDRVFVDGFSELRQISNDVFHFLRMVQSFFRYATSRGVTVVVSAVEGIADIDIALQATVDGIIRLAGHGHLRSLEVLKFRGGDFDAGPHPMRITAAGMEIFPEAA
jgi:circadian clock protein KaiC